MESVLRLEGKEVRRWLSWVQQNNPVLNEEALDRSLLASLQTSGTPLDDVCSAKFVIVPVREDVGYALASVQCVSESLMGGNDRDGGSRSEWDVDEDLRTLKMRLAVMTTSAMPEIYLSIRQKDSSVHLLEFGGLATMDPETSLNCYWSAGGENVDARVFRLIWNSRLLLDCRLCSSRKRPCECSKRVRGMLTYPSLVELERRSRTLPAWQLLRYYCAKAISGKGTILSVDRRNADSAPFERARYSLQTTCEGDQLHEVKGLLVPRHMLTTSSITYGSHSRASQGHAVDDMSNNDFVPQARPEEWRPYSIFNTYNNDTGMNSGQRSIGHEVAGHRKWRSEDNGSILAAHAWSLPQSDTLRTDTAKEKHAGGSARHGGSARSGGQGVAQSRLSPFPLPPLSSSHMRSSSFGGNYAHHLGATRADEEGLKYAGFAEHPRDRSLGQEVHDVTERVDALLRPPADTDRVSAESVSDEQRREAMSANSSYNGGVGGRGDRRSADYTRHGEVEKEIDEYGNGCDREADTEYRDDAMGPEGDALGDNAMMSRERHQRVCPICSKMFVRQYDVRRHLGIVHFQKRSFHCDRCDRLFAQKGHLNSHIKIVHESQRPYHCEHCGKTFSSKYNHSRHLRLVHP